MESKLSLKVCNLAAVGALTLAFVFGCKPSDAIPTPSPTRQFIVTSLCIPPQRPADLLKDPNLQQDYKGSIIPIDQDRNIYIRDYTNQKKFNINPIMLSALYKLYSQINLKSDLIKSSGDPKQYAYTPVTDGTTIIITDSPISFLKDCLATGMAFTANAPLETAKSEPDVSIISIDRVRSLGRGNSLEEKLTFALATEIGQQHDVFRLQTDFAESLNMGFGELIRFIQTNQESGNNTYENYVNTVPKQSFTAPATQRSIFLTIFSERIFNLASQSLTEPLVKIE